MIRVNLISGPRNISTALMYSFYQRHDTTVMDEPFYAVYLHRSGAHHPGREAVLQSQPTSEAAVLQQVFGPWPTDVLFIKNMAHHIEVLDQAFLSRVHNVFLIRNPQQIIASYAAVIERPVMRDIGIQYQYELFERMQRAGQQPVVLDAALLLQDPRRTLTALCQRLGISFMESMLQWPAGAKACDGVWASHWYTNVHRSTGFEKQPTGDRPLPVHLQPLYQQARAYYEKLLPFSLNP